MTQVYLRMCSCCCHGKDPLCSIYGCHFIKVNSVIKGNVPRFLMFSSIWTHWAATSSCFCAFSCAASLSRRPTVRLRAAQSGRIVKRAIRQSYHITWWVITADAAAEARARLKEICWPPGCSFPPRLSSEHDLSVTAWAQAVFWRKSTTSNARGTTRLRCLGCLLPGTWLNDGHASAEMLDGL